MLGRIVRTTIDTRFSFNRGSPNRVEQVVKGGLVAVRIRMMMLGRKHRPYFRIVAIDGRQPRDGRIIEELGTYDPMIKDTDKRTTLKPDRVKYWLSVGAQPSDRCQTLFTKYMATAEAAAAQAAAQKAAKAAAKPAVAQ